MATRRIPPTTLLAILVSTIAALIARQIIYLQIMDRGYDIEMARYLSYLVVPMILTLLLFPLWRTEKHFIAAQFRLRDLGWQVAGYAVAIGILLRAAWWSHLVATIAFGWRRSPDPDAMVGPAFSFLCPSPGVLALGFLVMACLVPLIEEIAHRGYVVSALRHRGMAVSILASALLFMVFHRTSSWSYAFLAGVVFAVMYWHTKSLWASTITHMTINGLIQIDWGCLSGQWNPGAEDIPLLGPGLIASASLAGCLSGIYCLLRKMAIGARSAPIAPH